MNAVLESSTTDGRWLRSFRTRTAIIDAWLELIEEDDPSPTAKGVADRAGIGLRTVFQHFSDMNSLHRAAGEELASRILSKVVHVPTDLPLRERIARITDNRAEVFEDMTSLRRACERQEPMSEEIHSLITDWEAVGARSTVQVFESEFSLLPDECRARLTSAVDAVVSWSNWHQLRQRRDLSIDDARAVIRYTLRALFGLPPEG